MIIDEKYKDYIGDLNPSGFASIDMIKYKANQISYEYESQNENFIVFSEVFYDKGWKAYIDDEEVNHIRVNYILRGLKVPSGKHNIDFKYDLPIYHTSSMVSLTGSLLIILLLLGLGYLKLTGREIPDI